MERLDEIQRRNIITDNHDLFLVSRLNSRISPEFWGKFCWWKNVYYCFYWLFDTQWLGWTDVMECEWTKLSGPRMMLCEFLTCTTIERYMSLRPIYVQTIIVSLYDFPVFHKVLLFCGAHQWAGFTKYGLNWRNESEIRVVGRLLLGLLVNPPWIYSFSVLSLYIDSTLYANII